MFSFIFLGPVKGILKSVYYFGLLFWFIILDERLNCIMGVSMPEILRLKLLYLY